MAVDTKTNLQSRAEEVKTETDPNDNSATRIGQLFRDIIDTALDGDTIASLYHAVSGIQAFTDALKTNLDDIETNATADQTGTEIAALLNDLSGADRLSFNSIKDVPPGLGVPEPQPLSNNFNLSTLNQGQIGIYTGSTDIVVSFPDGVANWKHLYLVRAGTGQIKINWGGSVTCPDFADIPNVLNKSNSGQPGVMYIQRTGTANEVLVASQEMIYQADFDTVDTILGADLLDTVNKDGFGSYVSTGHAAPTVAGDYVEFDGVDDLLFKDLASNIFAGAWVAVVQVQAQTVDQFRFGFVDGAVSNNAVFAEIDPDEKPHIVLRHENNNFDDSLSSSVLTTSKHYMLYLEFDADVAAQYIEWADLSAADWDTAVGKLQESTRQDQSNGAYAGIPTRVLGGELRLAGDSYTPCKLFEALETNILSLQNKRDLFDSYKARLSL